MSHATGYCRFPNGTVKYFLYDGTVDYARVDLHHSEDAAWATRDDIPKPTREIEGAPGEPVTLATNYAGGYHWSGRANLSTMKITAGHCPYVSPNKPVSSSKSWQQEHPGQMPKDGLPDWAK